MTGATKIEISASGFAPHIEELHDFFRSRSVRFGAPADLTPFVERLSKDESFRDEMSSMVRAIIYRERDGLTPVELLELLVTAVGGTSAEDAPDQVRDAVRQMLGFIGGVFRSRWKQGGSVTPAEETNAGDAATDAAPRLKSEDAATATAPAEASSRPMTSMFYQAQVVANGGEEPVKETKAAEEPKSVDKPKIEDKEIILPLRGTSEAAAAPFLNLAGYAAHPEPVAAFLRGEGTTAVAPVEVERRRSRGWMWVAMVSAVVIAFCAGMYTRQWMLTSYGMAWPWHLPAVSAPPVPTTPNVAGPAVNSGTAQQAVSGAAGVGGKSPAAARRPAQVKAARSTWPGGSESVDDVADEGNVAAAPGSGSPGGNAGAAQGVDAAAAASPAVSSEVASSQPPANAPKPSPEIHTNVARSTAGRATAMVGASPALMAGHLLFAPEPEYPQLARIAHIQGKVVVEALVGRDGEVVRAHAISGHRLLRGAAEDAVYGRRYRPYVVNDIPMAVRTLVTVNFRLR